MNKIGFAITGSFCTHDKILSHLKTLIEKGYDILPIVSESVLNTDTRFGKSSDFIEKLIKITGKKPVSSICEAEPIGPSGLIDALVIAPCTGNTLSKIANSVTDGTVTMVTKAHMRNNKPLIIGISTNDALGLNLKNIATLLNCKNVYFVPFGQDAPDKKPKSLVCDFSLLEETIVSAFDKKQLQPLLLK